MPCRRNKSTETVYKEVVVVGNGPSAISLSYMLAGNVPYYEGTSSDEFLHARLSQAVDKPLVLQELHFLSDGLEGRSSNPVSVLFDALSHPDADSGFEQPSLLKWRWRPDLSVDHVVLGKGKAGGAWKSMSDSNLLTVSFGSWMELPNLKMCEWRPAITDNSAGSRVTVSTVAEYYQDYVRLMSLRSHFEDDSVVTGIRKITEFSANDCLSMAKQDTNSHHDIPLPDVSLSDVPSLEENALFEHESSLYSGDMFEDVSKDKTRHSSDSAIADDDVSTVGSGGGATSWGDLDSCCSSGSVGLGNVNNSASDGGGLYLAAEEDVDMRRRALSGTRRGQLMQSQAQLQANISCCLELAKYGDQDEDDFYNLSWNPIVNPSFFSGSVPESGCSYNTQGRSYSWSNFNRTCSSKPNQSLCPIYKCFPQVSHLWEISGYRLRKDENGFQNGPPEEFRYLTKNVVLATGGYDRPNLLSVSGENLPFVFHSISHLEQLLASKRIEESSYPVMIVGAGLSAADAIIAALQEGIKVIHVFRRDATDRSLIFNNLPKSLYPEYHKVHRLMMSTEHNDLYKAYEKHHVVKILENKQIKLHGELSCSIVKVSSVFVLVGSKPNLDFLSENSGDGGKEIGILPGQPIGRHNPIDIDLFTHESIHQRGLYAMGPLVGDNFVRFLQGGALAITSNILKTQKMVARDEPDPDEPHE